MKNNDKLEQLKPLWEYTIDLAIALSDLLLNDEAYSNVRLLFQNGNMSISNDFKNQKELLLPLTSTMKLKSLWVNANNPAEKENPMQIQVVLHFQPQIEQTTYAIWKTDEQFNISLNDNIPIATMAQEIFNKIKAKIA